jgi:parvulin-like peptidyl-prolyl isomerase
MSKLAKLSLRLAVYAAVLAYIACDLFLFDGPLRKRINRSDPTSPESIAAAKQAGIVARVFNYQISRSQLEYALHEMLWLSGRTVEELGPSELKTARYAALDELIDHEILRVKAKANGPELKVDPEELDARLRRLASRFESRDAMETAMKSLGIPDEQTLRDRIAARIQQELYVESKVAPLSEVTEEEAKAWFDENQADLQSPAMVKARHIFLPTLDHPAEEAKARLETALADLTAGKVDFTTLSETISEDPATKSKGGDLGWMEKLRLPVDFATALFALKPQQPALVQTRLGWHIIEVTDQRGARALTFAEVKTDVMNAMKTVRRNDAAAKYRQALRDFEAAKIQVFHDMIDS